MNAFTIWMLLAISVGFLIFVVVFLLFLWLFSRRSSRLHFQNFPLRISTGDSKDPVKVEKVVPSSGGVALTISDSTSGGQTERVLLHIGFARKSSPRDEGSSQASETKVDPVKASLQSKDSDVLSVTHRNPFAEILPVPVMETSELACGKCFTIKELDAATNGFSQESIIGEGGYGKVYKGRLENGTLIAIKSLLNALGQAKQLFKIETEAIGLVRHKNIVRLLGLCMEERHRMLVYEYVDNGNLDQWLHGTLGKENYLTWDTRMKIILGTAKALAYLHESLEPKVIHRDIKSSNVLLDNQWNAKVSYFGLFKVLVAEGSYDPTCMVGTFGYAAPEYASTGFVNEKSNVYSFGVLLLETITGRTPVDLSRLPEEVHLVDWLRMMIGSRRSEEVLDPNILIKPNPRVLKRTLLVALLSVDPDPEKRPTMGHVVHMLESEKFPNLDQRSN